MSALGLFFALVIGLLLGLLGGGGSIVTVPVFVYALGYPAKSAIAMTLPVVATASIVGAVGHWRAGRVRFDVAIPFGLVAMAAAFGGARLARLVSGRAQLVTLGIVILLAAASMLRSPVSERTTVVAARPLWMILLAGAAVGVLTGFAGVGGGFLIVPALVLLARLPMKDAVGTSLTVMVMNTLSAFAGYVGGVHIDWTVLVPFTAVAVVGIIAGTRLVTHVPAPALRRAFAVMLVAIGALIVWQNALHG